jgi:hypothetical protein
MAVSLAEIARCGQTIYLIDSTAKWCGIVLAKRKCRRAFPAAGTLITSLG